VWNKILNTGKRQLHPTKVLVLSHHFAECVGAVRVSPHERFSVGIPDHIATARANGIANPLGGFVGPDRDARH